MSAATDLTVRKTISVACSVEHAFATFTEGISTWWPLGTHSIGDARAQEAVFERRAGGRIYEIWDDGREHDWGILLTWDPPHRLVYSWSPNPEQTMPTEVEVRFTSEAGGTRVELEHRGWERLGENATDRQQRYETGWDIVLAAYAEEAVCSV